MNKYSTLWSNVKMANTTDHLRQMFPSCSNQSTGFHYQSTGFDSKGKVGNSGYTLPQQRSSVTDLRRIEIRPGTPEE